MKHRGKQSGYDRNVRMCFVGAVGRDCRRNVPGGDDIQSKPKT